MLLPQIDFEQLRRKRFQDIEVIMNAFVQIIRMKSILRSNEIKGFSSSQKGEKQKSEREINI